jgi:hypothetical protein
LLIFLVLIYIDKYNRFNDCTHRTNLNCCQDYLTNNNFVLPITLEGREIDGLETDVKTYLYVFPFTTKFHPLTITSILRAGFKIHMRNNYLPLSGLKRAPVDAYEWLERESPNHNHPIGDIILEGDSDNE